MRERTHTQKKQQIQFISLSSNNLGPFPVCPLQRPALTPPAPREAEMAKWLKDYLSFGRKVPPQPPTPDYTESEILKAYRLQRDLDFEDPYEDSENRSRGESGTSDPATPVYGSPMKSASVDVKSPKHRLIKVDSQELGRTKILLSAISLEDQQEPVSPSALLCIYVHKKQYVMTRRFFFSLSLSLSCKGGWAGGMKGEQVKEKTLISLSFHFHHGDSFIDQTP